jgi:hypothetical protein
VTASPVRLSFQVSHMSGDVREWIRVSPDT